MKNITDLILTFLKSENMIRIHMIRINRFLFIFFFSPQAEFNQAAAQRLAEGSYLPG